MTAVTRHRLTDQERLERTMTGAELQRQVTDLAEVLGWSWCHFRPLRNRRGLWQVPVEGPLHDILRAAGLVVLVVRPSDMRDPIGQSVVYQELTR